MKNCAHCKTEFTPNTNTGHEQLYCTKKCKQRANNKRNKQIYIKVEKINKMKNCKNCNVEFISSTSSRGVEQMYCTVKCRQKASSVRNKQKLVQQIQNEIKSTIVNDVEIKEEKSLLSRLSEQEKLSGIDRFIHWFMELDEKLTAETILNVAKCFSWEEKFFYDFMNTRIPANPIKKTK